MISQIIADRINQLCKERNMSINQLAYKSHLTQSTLYTINGGKSKNTKIITLLLICYGFGITLQEFFEDKTFEDLKIDNLI